MQRNVMPTGEVLGTYRSREDTQATISYLAENGFNVRALSIVGSDVRIVETVMGITSWAQAAGRTHGCVARSAFRLAHVVLFR